MSMYQAQNFTHLLGLKGLSDALLSNHFALYEGYVKNVNTLTDLLLLKEAGTPEYAELKRRFGWEWNGMRLHEYYFENLSKEAVSCDVSSALYEGIVRDFGSFEQWEKDFRATSAMRGIGWTILVREDSSDGKLLNVWIGEHDLGHLVGAVPLLVLDVFEHAFMLNYGIKRVDYIDAFFKAIHWEKVAERFDHARVH